MAFQIPMLTLGSPGLTFYPRSLAWSDPKAFVAIDAVPDSGRYLVFLAVMGFLRLSPHYPPFDLLDPLPEPVRDDLRSGRALLVLDLSNEGPNFHKHIFDGLHEGMAAHDLPLSAAILVMQNRRMALDYGRTFGETGLKFGCHDFFVKMPLAQVDRDLCGQFDTAGEVTDYRAEVNMAARDFLCLNATPRWHRILLYRFLVLGGHAERGLVSFHGANSFNPKMMALNDAEIPEEVRHDFGDLIAGIDEWMPTAPVRFDTDRRTGNDLTASLETWAYNETLFSIVSESDFFEHNLLERVTEKIVKAATLGHPFIVVGNPYSIRFMAELGFDTFEGVIDHDYDRVTDHPERLRMVFREIERQQNAIASDRDGWIAATRDGALHNLAHARHGARYRYSRLVEQPLLGRLWRFMRTGSLDGPH